MAIEIKAFHVAPFLVGWNVSLDRVAFAVRVRYWRPAGNNGGHSFDEEEVTDWSDL